jgi:hypothetical protein
MAAASLSSQQLSLHATTFSLALACFMTLHYAIALEMTL